MKKSESIKKKIIKRFVASILIIVIIVSLFTLVSVHLYTDHKFKDEAEKTSNLVINSVLDGVDITALSSDKDNGEYERVADAFQSFCSAYKLHHMYLYTLEDGMIVRNVIASGSTYAAQAVEEDGLIGGRREPDEYETAIISGKSTQASWEENNRYGNVRCFLFGIYDSDGSLKGFLGIDYTESDIAGYVAQSTAVIIAVLVILLAIIFKTEYRTLNKNIFEPISEISDRMSRFVYDCKDTDGPMKTEAGAEIQSIFSSFEKMSVDIKNYVDNIESLTEERAKSEAMMDTARKIQMGFVPAVLERNCVSTGIYAIESPAKAVGGDFYDCFVQDGYLFGVVGDVSEKGISAALFMVVLKSKISDYMKAGLSPAEALLAVNDEMSQQNPEGMFATAFAFKLNLSSGEMTFANAGHNAPIIISSNTHYLDMNSGMLLGLMKGIPIKDETLCLKPSESILIYTDGVTEAVNKSREFFGEERLLLLLEGKDDKKPKDISELIKTSVDEFQSDSEQFDDITVFSLKYYGSAELTLYPELSAFDKITNNVFIRLGSNEATRKMLLACEEIFVNICSYAEATEVKVNIEDEKGDIAITVSDNGKPFNPLEYNKTKTFAELADGGMGISMAKQLAKEISYRYENSKNTLKMVFSNGGQ